MTDLLIAIFPIALLFILMLGLRLAGWLSAVITLGVTLLMCAFIPSFATPLPQLCVSLEEGAMKAVSPILLIIWMAIYSYNVLVESKGMDNIRSQLTSLTTDRGVLVLLITWGFGGLLEGMAGFGTSVAIPAAILISIGFKPQFAALVALLANTLDTGFGALGVPALTLCSEAVGAAASGEMIRRVSSYIILQLSPMFFLIPFALLMLADGKSWKRNLLLALWTGVVSFVSQFLCARYLGPQTPAIIGSVSAIVALIIAARVLERGRIIPSGIRPLEALRAWSIYIVILLLLLCVSPVVELPLNLNAPLMIFAGSIIGGLIQGLNMRRLFHILIRTLWNLRFTIITILSLVLLASAMNVSGMISAIATALVALTGSIYPLVAPFIGAIGAFVTGSDTSSNILFARLQMGAAHQLGLQGNSADWLLASNTAGASGGKMLSPQSIAIATASCQIKGEDDQILLTTLPYALAYVLISGVIVLLFI